MNKFILLLLVLLIPAAANGVEPGPTPLLTRLHVVAFHGDVEAIEELVEAGADVEARTRAGRTPISLAGHPMITQLLEDTSPVIIPLWKTKLDRIGQHQGLKPPSEP